MVLNLHLQIIYLLRQAEAARKEAERKALEESMAARKEEAERQTIEYTYEKRDSSYEGENVEQPKTTVTVLTQKDLARLKTLEEADTAYHKYALELKRMDQDMVPMTKEEFMKQNYPGLYSQTHQPAQAPHSIADFTKEQAKERLSQGQGSMPDAQWRQLVLRAQRHMTDKDWDGYKDGLHHTAQSASENLDALKNGYGKVTDGLAFQSFTPDGKDFLNKLGLPGKIFDAATLGAKETAIMTSNSQNKGSETAHLIARTVSGTFFGGLGAAGGAAVGAVAGFVAGIPLGIGAMATSTFGMIGGGVAGGYYGAQLGENVGNKIADFFFGKLPEERIK